MKFYLKQEVRFIFGISQAKNGKNEDWAILALSKMRKFRKSKLFMFKNRPLNLERFFIYLENI